MQTDRQTNRSRQRVEAKIQRGTERHGEQLMGAQVTQAPASFKHKNEAMEEVWPKLESMLK